MGSRQRLRTQAPSGQKLAELQLTHHLQHLIVVITLRVMSLRSYGARFGYSPIEPPRGDSYRAELITAERDDYYVAMQSEMARNAFPTRNARQYLTAAGGRLILGPL